jgi:hypothetical protein
MNSDLVETKNHTLEETAAIFDGKLATEKIVDSAAAQVGVAASHVSDEKGSNEFVEKA